MSSLISDLHLFFSTQTRTIHSLLTAAALYGLQQMTPINSKGFS